MGSKHMTDWKDFTLVVEVIDGVVNDVYVPNCDMKISWTVEEHETDNWCHSVCSRETSNEQ